MYLSTQQMIFTRSVLIDTFALFLSLIIIIIAYFKWSFGYWDRKKISTIEPSIPFGNLPNSFTNSEGFVVVVKNLHHQFKTKGVPHGGIYFFTRPLYMVVDLEFVKNILARHFQHFADRGSYYDEKNEPLSAHLSALGGTKWRNLRVKLTPTFTSGKMKMMFQTLADCTINLEEKVELLHKKKEPIDIKEVLGCFTTDIIGSCAFGLDCNSFNDDDSPFRRFGKMVFTNSVFRRLRVSLFMNFPGVVKMLKLRLHPKNISDFFFNVVKDNVEYREKHNYTRKDFMQLLIDLKNNKLVEEGGYKHDGKTLTLEEVTAQCYLFFLAGFETSSTTMTFALYELAKNQDIQKKVREEINTVLAKYDGKVSYDAIQEMKYMNQVLDETLRKHPPIPFITRQCIKDYKVPGEDVIIEEGTRVIISILGIHHDEDYYPDPEKFDPERFNEENSKSRHQFAHIPFGEGPRICIGLRFGLMQAKVGLTSLLRKYNFSLNKKTGQPMKFEANSFVLTVQGGVWLNTQKIE